MARVMFGGKKIYFAGTPLEAVLGAEPLTPPEMNKKIWEYIKTNGLFR